MAIVGMCFWPKSMSFELLCSIVSVVLGFVSIAISIVLYKISNDTSKKLAENAAKLAIQYSNDNYINDNYDFEKKQIKRIKKRINSIFKEGKHNSSTNPWVKASSILYYFRNELSEDKTVALILKWKNLGYIKWDNNLEISTQIYLENKNGMLESIDSC